MKKNFFLLSGGRLSRCNNTLRFVSKDEENLPPKILPIEQISCLYSFGEIDGNSALFNFLGKKGVSMHFFDYYEHYTGSFVPKKSTVSGSLVVAQAKHYIFQKKRMYIANKFLEGAAYNILRNLKYYNVRGKDVQSIINRVEYFADNMREATTPGELMGYEGNMRHAYYEAFDIILSDFKMGKRVKQPPNNEVNALISFLNVMCYTVCLDALYHTRLDPTIGYLHEPDDRKYALSLDLSEVFKPILVDRLIFKLLNRHILTREDFDRDSQSCYLNSIGCKKVLKAWEEQLARTIKYLRKKNSTSYRQLIKEEAYKLMRHIEKGELYKPFNAWW